MRFAYTHQKISARRVRPPAAHPRTRGPREEPPSSEGLLRGTDAAPVRGAARVQAATCLSLLAQKDERNRGLYLSAFKREERFVLHGSRMISQGARRANSPNIRVVKKVEGVELWSARVAPEYVPGHCRTAGGTSNGRNRAFRQVHGVLARVGIITATAVSSPAAPAVRLAGARTESRPHARIELPRLYGRLPCPPRGRRARCG